MSVDGSARPGNHFVVSDPVRLRTSLMSPEDATAVTLAQLLDETRKRDPFALESPDHLRALLADLAPTLPLGVLRACEGAARFGLSRYLMTNPGASSQDGTRWLLARDANLARSDAKQVADAYSTVLAGQQSTVWRPDEPPAPTAAAPTVWSSATVTSKPAEMPTRRSAGAPDPWSAPTSARESMPFGVVTRRRRRRSLPIVAGAAVVVLALALAGFFVVHGKGKKSAAGMSGTMPGKVTGVMAMPDGMGGVMVDFTAVSGATQYHIEDMSGGLGIKDTKTSSYTFATGGANTHTFQVRAMNGATMGPWSDPAPYAPPGTPSSAPASGAAMKAPMIMDLHRRVGTLTLMLSWQSTGATSYQVVDQDNPNAKPQVATGTDQDFPFAAYSSHKFVVRAMNGKQLGAPSDPHLWAPAHPLSASQAALALQLPIRTVAGGYCRGTPATDGASAEVYCTPQSGGQEGPSRVSALQFKPGAFASFVQGYAATGMHRGNCSDGQPSSGMSGSSPYPYYCVKKSGVSYIVWTYPGSNIALIAQGGYPTTMTAEFTWWKLHVAALVKVPVGG